MENRFIVYKVMGDITKQLSIPLDTFDEADAFVKSMQATLAHFDDSFVIMEIKAYYQGEKQYKVTHDE